MATKSNRLKAASTVQACQSKADAMRDIKTIGDLQRDLGRIEADINDQIADLTKNAAPRIEQLRERLVELQAGVQTWCEANRVEICGKGKSANLVTGEVSWRQRPPSVSLPRAKDKVEALIQLLRAKGLTGFVRSKDEINKDAILADKDKVKDIKGIRVVTGVEDFVITPFEVDVGETA